MPGQLRPVLDCLPFCVDTWSPRTATKRQQFLTHAHKDHLENIADYATNICCTELTKQLVLLKVPGLRARFHVLDEGCTQHFLPPDAAFPYSVTVLNANHCPGNQVALPLMMDESRSHIALMHKQQPHACSHNTDSSTSVFVCPLQVQ
eukprot:jgi/Chrzof1/14632/Cz09g10050.t1